MKSETETGLYKSYEFEASDGLAEADLIVNTEGHVSGQIFDRDGYAYEVGTCRAAAGEDCHFWVKMAMPDLSDECMREMIYSSATSVADFSNFSGREDPDWEGYVCNRRGRQ